MTGVRDSGGYVIGEISKKKGRRYTTSGLSKTGGESDGFEMRIFPPCSFPPSGCDGEGVYGILNRRAGREASRQRVQRSEQGVHACVCYQYQDW